MFFCRVAEHFYFLFRFAEDMIIKCKKCIKNSFTNPVVF